MITWCPAVITYAMGNIRGKIIAMRELGFADPIKMITSLPAITCYGMGNMRGKIAGMRELGFADPVKMITSSPTILNVAIDNIRKKVADLRELGFADPVKMITSSPAVLGYARERLLTCGRIVMGLDDNRADQLFAQLIKQPRAVIDAVAIAQPRTWSDVQAIIVATKRGAAKTAKS
jgi:hypothetical protein